jgi:hypothetical protein
VATPELVLTGWEPQPVMVAPAEVNATVPDVGAGATVAVNSTPAPKPLGFWSETMVVVVDAPDTGWLNVDDVLAAKFASPPNAATIDRAPDVV